MLPDRLLTPRAVRGPRADLRPVDLAGIVLADARRPDRRVDLGTFAGPAVLTAIRHRT